MINEIESEIAKIHEMMVNDKMSNINGTVQMNSGSKIKYKLEIVKPRMRI